MSVINFSYFGIFKSEAGNAMTTSLMVTGASAAISAFLFSQSLSTDHAARIPRIKSAMNQVEISLRAMILQPGTFTCTQAGATANADCKINLAFLSSLERELPGADSGAGGRCKIAIRDAGIGVAGNTTVNGSPFVATLKYVCASDSAESKIAAQKISVDIPGEVTTVSADTFTCADIDINKPILVGFTSSSGGSTGGIKCAAMKYSSCPANQFVSAIDYKSMKVTCSQISSTAVAAASNEMLGGLTWAGDTFTQTSLTRKNPSAYPAVGPMFTMISSKNIALVAKPSDASGTGSCDCDVPKTVCWNGNKICTSAGESCPPMPTPALPSPTPPTACTPGAVVDTGCIAPGLMGTSDGCSTGSKADPACVVPAATASAAPSAAPSLAPSLAPSVAPAEPLCISAEPNLIFGEGSDGVSSPAYIRNCLRKGPCPAGLKEGDGAGPNSKCVEVDSSGTALYLSPYPFGNICVKVSSGKCNY